MKGNISFKEIIGDGLNSFCQSVWTTFIGTYILFFYTDVAHISPFITGFIICAATLFELAASHISVFWIRKHRFINGERIRPFLVYSSIVLAVMLVLTFTVFGTGYITIILAALTVFVLKIPASINTLCDRTMNLSLSSGLEENTSLSKIRFASGAVGSVFVSTLLYVIICAISGVDGAGNMLNSKLGFMVGAGIVAVIVIAVGLFYYTVSVESSSGFEEELSLSSRGGWSLLLNRGFRHNMIITFFNAVVKSIMAGLILYYCKYFLYNTNLFIPISAVFIIGVVLAVPLVSKIRPLIGSVGTMVTASLILVIGSIIFILFAKSFLSAFILAIAVGLGTQMLSVMLNQLRLGILDRIERDEGIHLNSMMQNAGQLPEKLAFAVMAVAFAFVMEKSGFDPSIVEQLPNAEISIVLLIGIGILFSSVVIGVLSAIQINDSELK